MVDPFTVAEESLEEANPTGWRWEDLKTGEPHDGRKLIGFYVSDDEYTRDGRESVPVKVIRTKDGRYRSLFLWPGDDEKIAAGEFDRNAQLIEAWDAAAPEFGDMVAIRLDVRTSETGRRYGVFAVVPTRRAELERLGCVEQPDLADSVAAAEAPDDGDPVPF